VILDGYDIKEYVLLILTIAHLVESESSIVGFDQTLHSLEVAFSYLLLEECLDLISLKVLQGGWKD